MIDTHERAWAAGFFDGEGWTGVLPTQRNHVRIGIGQVDRYVLERFQAAVCGIGIIHGPYREKRENRQPKYEYRVSGHANVQAVIALLWKYLSPIKQKQAAYVLWEALEESQRRYERSLVCKRGHPLRTANAEVKQIRVKKNGKEYYGIACVICIREGKRAKRKQEKTAKMLASLSTDELVNLYGMLKGQQDEHTTSSGLGREEVF